jgi:uncharacterized membrane protein YfcA
VPAFDFLSDPLFWVVAAAAFAGSLIRGFSGFGSGLVFMPIGAACLGPKPAAGVLFIIDTLLIIPFVVRAARIVEWREVLPLGLGAVLMVPVGVAVLFAIDPVPLRWGLSLAILGSIALLWAGLRYRGRTRTWLSILVGGIAGFMSGSAQIPGPPVLIYWLGRDVVPVTMRANAIVFFCFTTVIAGIFYVMGGIFTGDVMARSAVLFPVYAIGIFIGGRMFGWASEKTYRTIAYASIVFSAVISLPVFG